MIYFMQPTAGGPVKIGFSDNVDARRLQLESRYGQPLTILATMPGGREDELRIHRRFARHRFGRTEQFRPTRELAEFIGCPEIVSANPETVEAMGAASGLTMRVSVEWRDWLDELAKHLRMPTSAVVDNALVEYARTRGFTKEAPER